MPSQIRNTQWPPAEQQQSGYYQQQYPSQQQQQQSHLGMGDRNGSQPRLGATFYPGGQDDFYMPEVISPLPQRVMADGKIEADMQQGLATLELEARNNGQPNRTSSISSIVSPIYEQQKPNFPPRDTTYSITPQRQEPNYPPRDTSYSFPPQEQNPVPPRDSSYSFAPPKASGPGFTASYNHTNAVSYQNLRDEFTEQQATRKPDAPKFSPFPRVLNPGKNVPLSDDDKEEVLERARSLVLRSNDPEMQLAWAQDALSWVEVASNQASREQESGQPTRSITPKIEHDLRVDAINIVQFLADQHHPKAEFMRGMWQEFGKFGYRVDKKEAFLAYRRAAEKGYARAEYRIGMQYESSSNAEKAIEHYRKGVALKDSASRYRLGMMTLMGQHGVPRDYQRGVDLIRYAADTADENAPQGAYIYGMLLARDLENIKIPEQYLPFDENDAKLFIEKAAYLGFAKAQLKMAQAYELCRLGCEFEPSLSLHYNALASRQGESEADMAISKWFLCGYEGVFEKNEEQAFIYAKRAAATKMATAEFALGYFYEIGVHVKQDLQESQMWYKRAAEHGNTDALSRIDSIQKNSVMSRKDHEQVAISRIKSQYGSQRGGRPDRFKQKAPPMPSMAEDRVDFPDPRKSFSRTPQPQINVPIAPQVNIPPVRPVSVAPYPEDDRPPKFQSQQSRPAPYPTEDNNRLNPRPGPQADRPSSAFGIRPLVHTNTDGYGQPGRGSGPIRPATSQANMQIPVGRNYPGGRGQPGGFESQIPAQYRDPRDPRGPLANRQPTIPQVDSGRPRKDSRLDSRPDSRDSRDPRDVRMSGFDPRTQPGYSEQQKAAAPNLYKAQPQPPNEGYTSGSGSRPSSSGQRPSSSHGPVHLQRPASPGGPMPPPGQRREPAASQYQRPERGSSTTPISTQGPNNSRPDRSEYVQSPASIPPPAASRPSALSSLPSQRPAGSQGPSYTMPSQSNERKPTPQQPVPSSAPSTTPSAVPSAAPFKTSGAPAGAKLTGPKKGPSTFDEMGIPAGKNESDCAVM